MSGFSEEVATAVIQLEWPASEPLKESASDMMYRCIGESEQQRRPTRLYRMHYFFRQFGSNLYFHNAEVRGKG